MRIRTSPCASFLLTLALLFASVARADVFFPIEGVSVEYPPDAGGAYWPEANLIQGAVIGFDVQDPHGKLLDGDVSNWVTDACAYPCGYIEVFGSPIINLDLGQDRTLTENCGRIANRSDAAPLAMLASGATRASGMLSFAARSTGRTSPRWPRRIANIRRP